ncbi:PAS-domain containing protein [Marinovum sp.]|uniref:PAS-domain containing protein n=1 Tax=Marinovum sp. TaxID=2024839 RepID=UPI002B2671FD|nr:PAS-domain containing protein [Marinovum sp.]
MLVDLTIPELAVLLAGSLLGTLLTALALRHRTRQGTVSDERTCFLFHDTELVDATGPAAVLAQKGEVETEDPWQALRAAFRARFGDLPERPGDVFAAVAERRRTYAALAPEDGGRLVFSRHGDRVRVSLLDDAPEEFDRQISFDQGRELRFLRNAVAEAPTPIWLVDDSGRVTWQNRAYSRLAAQTGGAAPGDAPLFAVSEESGQEIPLRVPLQMGEGAATNWFAVSSRRTPGGLLSYASNIDAVVHAEQAQRNFVQTLSKTFAHLSTGLAIFDRNQRLALFNPALIDLTAMPAEFLTSKPSLAAFFDYLREHQIMPEPKNYASWRDKIGALIAAARDGRYSRTWNLPSGLTYRITGKPHPDGAIAFLFEDISAEISLTRRFRAELETSHAVLDRQEKALAVFSQLGALTFSNEAFRQMWRFDPDSSFAETTVPDVLKIWQSECAPCPAWEGLQGFVTSFGERLPREAEVLHHKQGRLSFRAEPRSGGATLVSFTPASLTPDRPERISRLPVRR